MSLDEVEGGFWARDGSDFVLGAATGGVMLAGDTKTFFSFPSLVSKGSLVASAGGVSIVIGFKSLFKADSLCERLGIVHCSRIEHLWSKAATFCSSKAVLLDTQASPQFELPAASASICL